MFTKKLLFSLESDGGVENREWAVRTNCEGALMTHQFPVVPRPRRQLSLPGGRSLSVHHHHRRSPCPRRHACQAQSHSWLEVLSELGPVREAQWSLQPLLPRTQRGAVAAGSEAEPRGPSVTGPPRAPPVGTPVLAALPVLS